MQIENEGNPLTFTAIRQIIVSPEGETVIPAIFGDGFAGDIEDTVFTDGTREGTSDL